MAFSLYILNPILLVVTWSLVLMHQLGCIECVGNALLLHMSSFDERDPLHHVSFCVGCNEPDMQGSLLYGLGSRHGLKKYSVTGEITYCIPNYAEDDNILNEHQFANKIVLVDRGKVPVSQKVRRIIKHQTPLAIIIADDGQCKEDYSYCGIRSGSVKEKGFIPGEEEKQFWESLNMPVMILTTGAADRLRKVMLIEKLRIPGLGSQNVSMLHPHEEEL